MRRRELAHGLQQPVARRVRTGLGQHQRLVHQPREQVQHLVRVDIIPRAHRLGRLQVPATCEDRQAAEEGPFLGTEQRVAPRQRRAQRLLPRRPGAVAAGQQAHAIVQAVEDLPRGQRPDPRRRQLQRQRDAVQAGADPGDYGGVLGRQLEFGIRGPGAVQEELHRRDARQVGERGEGGQVR
jgi:hypothetical protein